MVDDWGILECVGIVALLVTITWIVVRIFG